MTPEEKYEKDIWDILQKIKLQILRGEKYKLLVKHRGYLNEKDLIQKLEDEDVVKIIENSFKYASLYHLNNPATAIPLKAINVLDYIETPDVIFLKILPEFDKFYKKYKQKFPNTINRRILKYKSLKLDLDKGEIRYRERKPISIQPNSNNIRFLEVLLRTKSIVGYRDIAKKLNLSLRYKGVTDEEVAQQVNSTKRELVDFLKEVVRMEVDEISEMIINIKKIGYKLGS